jgi:hypothetical protein
LKRASKALKGGYQFVTFTSQDPDVRGARQSINFICAEAQDQEISLEIGQREMRRVPALKEILNASAHFLNCSGSSELAAIAGDDIARSTSKEFVVKNHFATISHVEGSGVNSTFNSSARSFGWPFARNTFSSMQSILPRFEAPHLLGRRRPRSVRPSEHSVSWPAAITPPH